MIQDFATAATIIALLISAGCGVASYSCRDTGGGGEYGGLYSSMISGFFALVSFIAGLIGVVGVASLIVGRS